MVKIFDRDTFFTYIRRSPFGNRLSQQQVDGIEAILNHWETQLAHKDVRFLAYVFATVFHETGGLMVPVREGFAKTDAGARKVVANRKYGVPDPQTGHVYYGRGHVQLTWADNYKRMGDLLGIELYRNPDKALEPAVSIAILFEGMLLGASSRGDFTGKALEHYFNATTDDPEGARRIINGTDKAKLIASYHVAFLDSLKAALQPEKPADVAPAVPDGPALFKDKTMIGAITAGSGGLIANAIGAIYNPWALIAFLVVAVGVFLVVTGRIEIKTKAGA